MQQRLIQVIGLALSAVYAAAIIWIYATEPRSFKEMASEAQVAVGTYQVDQEKFNAALTLFRRDQFRAARDEWKRADAAQSDPRTQFYIAYSYYRSGWGRVYQDNELFNKGLVHADKAIALAPGGRLVVDDPDISIHNADELRAELAEGLRVEASDFNPMRVFRQRK